MTTDSVSEQIKKAFSVLEWEGPWDKGTVHTHEPPFCWSANLLEDCTLRVVEMARDRVNMSEIARIGKMSFVGLRERLRERGCVLTKRPPLTRTQCEVLLYARKHGWTRNHILEEVATLTKWKLTERDLTRAAPGVFGVYNKVSTQMRLTPEVVKMIWKVAQEDHVRPGDVVEIAVEQYAKRRETE